jgi:hypothetical protein
MALQYYQEMPRTASPAVPLAGQCVRRFTCCCLVHTESFGFHEYIDINGEQK